MNVARLLALSARLLDIEAEYKLQSKLESVRSDLANIASNPSEAAFQTSLVENLASLRTAFNDALRSFTPVEQSTVDELINGSEFSLDLYRDIKAAIDQNGLTPSVAQESVDALASTRARTLEFLKGIKEASEFFGWSGAEGAGSGAILEFTVPRNLFDNKFHILVNELDFLRKLIALIAESSDDDPNAELVSMSTTDPTISVLVAYGVALSFGKVVSWGLSVWKEIEEIRALRSQTKKIGVHSDDEIRKFIDDKIDERINASIESEAQRLTEKIDDRARANEVENGLIIFLKPFLARMERGLTIDVKLLENDPVGESDQAVTTELRALSRSLVFPQAVGDPVLKLTAPDEVKITRYRKKRKSRAVGPTPDAEAASELGAA